MTPSGNISREASLPLIKALCNYYKRRHTLRVCLANPMVNLASGRLYPSFSATTKHRLLFFKDIPQNKASYRQAIWFNPSNNKIHLPINELSHILGNHFPSLVETEYSLRFLQPGGYSDDTPPTKLFPTLIYEEWNQALPLYRDYSYPMTSALLPVMVLDRFTAG